MIPKTFVADCAPQITKVIQEFDQNCLRISRWFHTLKNIELILKSVNSDLKNEILGDIKMIQPCFSKMNFYFYHRSLKISGQNLPNFLLLLTRLLKISSKTTAIGMKNLACIFPAQTTLLSVLT